MSDLIDRDEVIEIIESVCSADDTYWEPGTLEKIRNLPTHPTPSNTLGALDCVSRQDAIDAVKEYFMFSPREGRECAKAIERVPSAQPETAKRIVGKSRNGMTLWYQCDMCNEPVDVQDNYCRGCGRRLIDE